VTLSTTWLDELRTRTVLSAVISPTVKLGVFSLWNGQQAFHSRPARISLTVGAITALSTVRARSSSSQAVERVTTRPYARIAEAQTGLKKLSTDSRSRLI
jgi:hypothetical protein